MIQILIFYFLKENSFQKNNNIGIIYMRSFKIDAIKNTSGNKVNFTGGRYISNTPSGAAKKAFSSYNKLKKSVKSLKITMKETTQGSAHKTFNYKVSKIKSDMERELPNGDVIKYAYEIKTKSI